MAAQPRTIGRYAIIDRLGQGGMGVVYRAWDPELRRQVAIKVIAFADDPLAGPHGEATPPGHADAFERSLREAQTAASLAHPHIVTIFDVARHAGRPYIVMELVDGDTLARVIQRGEAHPLADRVRWAIDLCDGLAFAHTQGVVHRDVKPANIMLSSTGGLKILDFGIARITDELSAGRLTRTGGILGTPQYMSPEQVAGQPADARSDIFSVGAVLYELFTGRPPFQAPTPAMVAVLVLQQSPAPMHGVPLPLQQLVAHALEKDPTRRFQRLEDVAIELRAWLRDAGEDERSLSPEAAGEDARPLGGDDLGGLLAQWEVAIGHALDEPVPPATPTAPPPIQPQLQPQLPPQPQPRPQAASPVRRGPYADRRAVAALLLVALLLGGAGAYWQVGRGTAAEQRPVPASPASASEEPKPLVVKAWPDAAAPSKSSPAGTAAAAGARATTSAPSSAPAPLTPRVKARCSDIVQRVGLGEELTDDDRDFLSRMCRERNP